MSVRRCTTHFHACDCREDKFKEMRDLISSMVESHFKLGCCANPCLFCKRAKELENE